MPKLEITNKRILKFYESNPTIDFQTVNLLFIDLFEKLALNGQENVIGSQLLTTVANFKDEMTTFKSYIASANAELLTKTVAELKSDYVKEIHQIVQTNTHDQIAPLLEKNNCFLMEKTSDIIHEILPNNRTHISQILNEFATTITNDTLQFVKSSDHHASIKDFINNFEMKSSMIMQPIYSYISASEERTNSNIKEGQLKVISEFSEILNKFKEDQTSQPFIDKHLTTVLTKLYSTSEVQTKNNAGGLIVLKRQGRPNIIIENRDIESNVATDDIQSFALTVDDQNCNGIFLSQRSGISTKKNYHIEIHNNNIMVFVHHVEYNSARIAAAVDIIDQLYNKMRQFRNSGGDDCSIPKDVMDTINNEYQMFLSQKNAVIEVFKESQKKVLAQVDEIRFPALDKFLSTKYTAPIQKSGLKCDLCKSFSANNLKALAAHKRGCIRKHTKPALTVSTTTAAPVVTPPVTPYK
jgi:hypothetical protein